MGVFNTQVSPNVDIIWLQICSNLRIETTANVFLRITIDLNILTMVLHPSSSTPVCCMSAPAFSKL